jgi:hypothetical protein
VWLLFLALPMVPHDCEVWRRAAVFVAVVLLTPWRQHSSSSSSIRVASGQGLSVSADNLGAGAEATANEFEQFESALELATTGGRGSEPAEMCSHSVAVNMRAFLEDTWRINVALPS